MLGGHAEPVDEAAAHRERRVQRDLLRGDRGHERLEGIRCERWAEARHASHRVRKNRIALRELVERRQVELEAEQLAYDRLDLVVERLDVHAALGRRDPDLAAVDDTMQTTVVPDVRAIDAPEREAVERPVEVVRLRYRQQAHARSVLDRRVLVEL